MSDDETADDPSVDPPVYRVSEDDQGPQGFVWYTPDSAEYGDWPTTWPAVERAANSDVFVLTWRVVVALLLAAILGTLWSVRAGVHDLSSRPGVEVTCGENTNCEVVP